MSKPKLALIPSGYKSGKVYSILPNDATGDFDFDRASEGTRVRKDGLIEEVTNDSPRLDWLNSTCPSLLLEPQRTNLAHYSEQTDNAYWNKIGVSVTANQITSPNGTLTADKLQRTSTSSSRLVRVFTKTASEVQNFTLSVFVKKGDSRYSTLSLQGAYPNRAYLQYDFEQGTINASIDFANFTILSTKAENYNNGWVRLSLALSTDAHSSVTVLISPKNDAVTTSLTDSSDSCFMYVWGIQLENYNYSTSYIKTEASTVTRLKDECLNGGDSDLFNITEGTFFVDVTPFTYEATERITLSNNNYNNRILISKANATQLQFIIVSDNVTVATFTTNITYNIRNKIAFTFKENEFKFYLNGSLVYTSPIGSVPTGLNDLSFKGIGSALYWNGKVHDTRVYDRVLTEAETIELTTL